MRGSTRAYPPPAVNRLVKAPYPSKVAYRDVEVQFNPRQIFANTAVNWNFKPSAVDSVVVCLTASLFSARLQVPSRHSIVSILGVVPKSGSVCLPKASIAGVSLSVPP
ncbi:hypothetical protein N8525_03175 [Verrucomicrobiales bacterium]|jgi:hypothetical protein|nr:hypothetical protein [Verrucomicrobiales bacterium]